MPKLVPEVKELLASGELHPIDAEWIGRLRPESQLAAAKKCIRNFGVTQTTMDNPRSCIGGRHNA